MKETGRINLVYILAASHSGSTLLSMLLGAHPEVCTVGEIKATSFGVRERYLCSCRKKIRECLFWTDISSDMAGRGFAFDITDAKTDIGTGSSRYVRRLLAPLHRGPFLESLRDFLLSMSPAWRKQLPKIQAVNVNLMECLLSRSGKNIIVDSSKIGIRLKYLLRNPLLDVKIIRLIRDGRDVAVTYMDPAQYADAKDPSLRDGGTGGNRKCERLNIAQAAREWRRSNEEAEAILRGLDSSMWIEARYENLCQDAANTLNQLFSFIGVDPAIATTDFRSVEHHVVGNGMRLDSTSEIRFDTRWKAVLTDSDISVFNSIAGGINQRLGYQE